MVCKTNLLFPSWTVPDLLKWIHTSKKILHKNKLSPSSKLIPKQNYTNVNWQNQHTNTYLTDFSNSCYPDQSSTRIKPYLEIIYLQKISISIEFYSTYSLILHFSLNKISTNSLPKKIQNSAAPVGIGHLKTSACL